MKHSKVIRITDYLTIKEHWTAEDIYKTIKYMGMNPRYKKENDIYLATIEFVYLGNPYTICLEKSGKNARVRKIFVVKRGGQWEDDVTLTIYKRHWWY